MGGIGYSVNMITMVALLIALGLLMDDAIVISENIAAHLRRGKKALEAAIDGTREVAPGVLSSFLTSCAIFGPLAFISGDIGRVLKVLPVVLILVLAVSLVEAFLILPNHLAHSLQGRDGAAASRNPGRVDRVVAWCKENVVGRAVDFAVHWRYAFVGSVIALFVISVAMVVSGRLGFLAFPDIEGDVVEARVLLPQGAPLDRTKSVADALVAALGRVNEQLSARESNGDRLVQSVTVRYAKNADAAAPGPHVATVTVNLLTAEKRASRIDEILELWRQETGAAPDVLNLSFKDPTIGPAGRAIDIRLQGENLIHLESASQELVQWLSRYRGVKDVLSDLRPGKPERQIRLREDALGLGLDAQTVAAQLRATFFGTTAYEVQVGTESLEIDVRASPQDTDSLEDLENFRLVAADGALVPLLSIADIHTQRGFSRIQRIDRVRTVTVQGDVDVRAANAISIVNDTQSRFIPALLERYPGVTVSLEGEAAEAGQTGSSVRNGFALGLVGVFLLLSFQFRSYIEPLVVMSIIPLAFIGVVWGHLFMGLDLSMPSIMGFVSLSGIVVNDSILLVSFLKRRREQGQATVAAARLASRDRFRAVMLTSLTTIAGLLPLLSERSLQAQVLTPLVTSIAFGLMATTLLVLLVVPALYSILDDFGLSEASAGTAQA
jgi:multidrug efflux pump subunit AcrB